jgi:hypothetical protein
MPGSIRDSYQYFTQAETTNLRRAGYNADFTALEEAVRRYVTGYLDHAALSALSATTTRAAKRLGLSIRFYPREWRSKRVHGGSKARFSLSAL